MELKQLQALLLSLLGVNLSQETVVRLTTLTPDDWQQLADLAHQQCVSPLLYHRLVGHQLQTVLPADLLAHLQGEFHTNGVRNLQVLRELGQLLTVLQQQGIPTIVLKGAHLAGTIYRNPALRFMVDLDLMVPEADLPMVIHLLLEQGYKPMTPIALETHLLTAHHLPRFLHPSRQASVEIHWTITLPNNAYTISMDEVWSRAQPVTLVGVQTLSFCPEDLLLHICLHATYQHLFEQGVRPLCDIDALVRHHQTTLDWTAVIRRAQEWHWAKGVHLMLTLAHLLMSTPIPPEVLTALDPYPLPQHLIHSAVTEIFASDGVDVELSRDFIRLWNVPEITTKGRLLLQRIFLSPTMIAQLYGLSPHSPRILFYYIVRLQELILRYQHKLWRLPQDLPAIKVKGQRQAALQQWLAKGEFSS